MKVSNFIKATVISLACVMALSIPAQAAQGNGKAKGRNRVNIARTSTPGVPTSPLGRGRNYYPRTPRGRYVRSTSIIRTRNGNIIVPRKIKRGRYIYQGTRRGRLS